MLAASALFSVKSLWHWLGAPLNIFLLIILIMSFFTHRYEERIQSTLTAHLKIKDIQPETVLSFFYLSLVCLTLNIFLIGKYIFIPSAPAFSTFELLMFGSCASILLILFSSPTNLIKFEIPFTKIFSGIGNTIAGLILMAIILEGSTRLLILANKIPNIPTPGEISATDPQIAPDLDDPAKIYAFMTEYTHKIVNISFLDSNLNLYNLPLDYQGAYISNSNGMRNTTDQPEKYQHTIYLFGGSTVYCQNSPDEYTIASYLQRLFNEQYGHTYRVLNMGIPSIKVQHQNDRLAMTDFGPGDIIIYYDGKNDIASLSSFSFFQNRLLNPNIPRVDEKNDLYFKIYQHFTQTLLRLGEYSTFIHYIRTYNWTLHQKPYQDTEWLNEQISKYTQEYQKQIQIGYQMATNREASFFHYIQPTIFSQSTFTAHEQKILDSFGTEFLFPYIEDAFVNQNHVLTDMGIHSVDLTHILSPENRPGIDIFFDHCHVNYYGNKMIAQAIFNDLERSLSPQE